MDRKKRRQPGDKANAGFTIMELMVVVLIIAISATLAGPAFQSQSDERRTSLLARDVVRIVQNMKSESMAYGRAYLLRFDTSADSLTLYKGVTNLCNNQVTDTITGWSDIIAAGDCETDDTYCVAEVISRDDDDSFDLDYEVGTGYIDISSVASKTSDGDEDVMTDLCMEPLGDMYWRRGANINSKAFMSSITKPDSDPSDMLDDSDNVNGGILFKFQRKSDNGTSDIGVARYVAVPLGGDARVLR